MKISLVVSDVDATLITPEHEITPRTAEAVRELQKRGIAFYDCEFAPAARTLRFCRAIKFDRTVCRV